MSPQPSQFTSCAACVLLLAIGACRRPPADREEVTRALELPDAIADAAEGVDAAPDTAHQLGTGWLDSSVEPTSMHVRCRGSHAARAVRFVISPWRRDHGHMRSSLSSANGEIEIPIYDSGDALGQCASLVVDDGAALRFRCPGEVAEVRGEARWMPPILHVTVAIGYFGYTTGLRRVALEKKDLEWPCADRVTFVAASRSDYDFKNVPWNIQPSFVLPFDQVEQ